MPVYLTDIPLAEAWQRFEKALSDAELWGLQGEEVIPLDENAVGRVLSHPVWAKVSSPHYHAAAMDGFAVFASLTQGAGPSRPITLEVGKKVHYVDTGDPMPADLDAVIPVEDVEPLDESGNIISNMSSAKMISIHASVSPWNHVRPLGEDLVASQLVLPQSHVLRPVDLGALAASGATQLLVSIKPRVGVIPTGTELVDIGKKLQPGAIIEFNSIMLSGQVNSWGGTAKRYSIVKDDFNLLVQKVKEVAEENDLVLVNAGSSAGSEDFTSKVVETLGELLVHGIAIRPGHPVILGIMKSHNGKRSIPIIGVPGYPVSAAMTGEIFVKKLIYQWLGKELLEPTEVNAILTRKINSPAGDDDYVRMVVGQVGEKLLAAPLARGAGVISSLVHADGITIIPRGIQGISAGESVKVRLNSPDIQLDRTIFMIGSHDMTLDLLSQFLAQQGRRLISVNVGSQGGLIALSRGEAHAAGCHLLDPQTGDYNLLALREYLPGIPVLLLAWVKREQGLMVKKGNPKKIKNYMDLSRVDIQFINRQRGAGTRVLLDYRLKKLEIPVDLVNGYKQEEFTHLAVAAAVASGRTDCGLGIAAAAQALDLDFIPLDYESYDLVIKREFVDSDLLAPLFDVANNKIFQTEIRKMPGYDTSDMGKILLDQGSG